MKKVAFLSVFCLLAITIQSQRSAVLNNQENSDVEFEAVCENSNSDCLDTNYYSSEGYVDLGLPSGTKWKSSNAKGRYTYNEAISKFGKHVPTKAQWEELSTKCYWTWTGNGSKVEGPNGNYIVLPAEGVRNCSGKVILVGVEGHYWSSTQNDSDHACCFFFGGRGGRYTGNGSKCGALSVRLVQ